MFFSTFTKSIWIDYLENITKEQEKRAMSKRMYKRQSTLRNFLCGNRLQQLEVARTSFITAICKRNFFLSRGSYSALLVALCASSNVDNF